MLAQLGARLRSLERGDPYWEQNPVTEVGAIRMVGRVRARWEAIHNTSPAPRRFDLRAVIATNDRETATRAAPPLAEADWLVPLPLEWIDAQGKATPLDDAFFAQREYRLPSLTGFPDAVFVSIAFRTVLKRAPDRTGFHIYLSRLRTGEFDRIDVLRSLMRSSEAQPIGVRIPKLRALDVWRRAQHVRFAGPFVAWFNAFLRLARLARRQQVLEAQAAASRREEREQTQQIIAGALGPFGASLAALQLARGQIEDALTAIAHVLERLDAQSRRRTEDGDAQALRLDDRLDRLDAAAEFARERLAWIEQRVRPADEAFAGKDAHGDDPSIASLCAGVEARLRAATEDTALVEHRLALVREAGLDTSEAPVLDLGCGRGDWLAALREAGIPARGVDASRALVDACRERGLAADHGDPSRWIAAAPAGGFGVVSVLHQVDAMPLAALVALLREIRRVLAANGLLLVETTEADREVAGPVRPGRPVPLTPAVLEYLVASQGFEHIRIEVGAVDRPRDHVLVARAPRADSSSTDEPS